MMKKAEPGMPPAPEAAPEPSAGLPVDLPAGSEPVAPELTAAAELPAGPDTAPVVDGPVVPRAARPGPAARAAAAVVAAALLGVGIGFGVLQVRYDDEPVAAAAPAAPSAGATGATGAGPSYGAKANGTHFGSMRDLLVPLPAGYRPGPDSGAYGNDTELSEAQRKAWVEDEVRGLPSKLQDALRKDWQQYPLKGGGVRSFTANDSDAVTATVWLLQYHQEAVKADDAWVSALGSDTGLFRLGPQVPGHSEAHCYLPALDPGAEIDSMHCSAAVGDLRVVFNSEGVVPLPKDRLVTLFAQQLDRLALPGASA